MKRKWVSPLYQFHRIKPTIRIISFISWWGRHSSWRKNDCCEDLSFATDASRTARRRPRIRHFAQSFFRLEPIGVLHHRCSLWNFAVATVSIHFLPTTAADGMRLFNTRIQSKSFRSMIPFPIDIYIFMIFVFSLHCNERLNLLLNLFCEHFQSTRILIKHSYIISTYLERDIRPKPLLYFLKLSQCLQILR